MLPIVQAFGTFAFLAFASWCVGEGGEILGKKYDASIIGGLVIAWLNTAPEAIFFITALSSSNVRFAVGAVSGSSIVVCTVALGACLWIGSKSSKRKGGKIQLQPQVKKQCLILLLSLFIPLAISIVGFHYIFGVLAVIYYLVFIAYSLFHKLPEEEEKEDDKNDESIKYTKLATTNNQNNNSTTNQNNQSNNNENGADASINISLSKKEENAIEKQIEKDEEDEHDEPLSKGVLMLLVGGIIICFFSKPFIDAIVELATTMNINPILLAFFLAPIASEMPEILESISLSRKGNSQNINIAYSNLIGGTITKTSLLMGIFSFYGSSKEFIWESPTYSLSLSLVIICAAGAGGMGYFYHRLNYRHGLFLFVLFAITGFVQYYYNINLDQPVDDNLSIPTTNN